MKTKFLPLLAAAFLLIGCPSEPIDPEDPNSGGDNPGTNPNPGGGGGTGNVIKPSSYQYSHITSKYDSYKTRFLKYSGNNYCYIYATGTAGDGEITVSEAHGYGMIIFALMGDKEIFDKMNAFRKAHLSTMNNGLMAWYIKTVGQVPRTSNGDAMDGSAATDGDLDIAYALLLASKKWGGNYKNEAVDHITKIKNSLMSSAKRTKLGDWKSINSMDTRSSDWMPGHFEAFYKATNDNYWRQARDTVYKLLGQVSNSNTGLVPDFVTGTPARADASCGGASEANPCDIYSYNACRVPWRIALDYAHNGENRAKTQIDKISAWLKDATGENAADIKSSYNLNGSVANGYDFYDIIFAAPFAAGMIANSNNQSFLNKTYDNVRGKTPNEAYAAALQLLSMLLITGNWEAPN